VSSLRRSCVPTGRKRRCRFRARGDRTLCPPARATAQAQPFSVLRAHQLDAITDLAKHNRAHAKIRVADRRVPRGNVRIASPALTDLGDGLGIGQVTHRFTPHPRSRPRSRSIPSSGAEASSALSAIPGAVTRSGAETICARRPDARDPTKRRQHREPQRHLFAEVHSDSHKTLTRLARGARQQRTWPSWSSRRGP
jgi:hypothetical protein